MALYIIGDFIKETRLRKGYTQEEVSFGICTPASLSRIENGVQTPGRYILDKLLERLGTENNVFNIFVNRNEMELYELLQELARDIADGRVSELEEKVPKLEEMTKDSSELERQYLYYAKGELARKHGASDDEVMEWFMKAIHITLPQFDGVTPLESNLLTFDEIVIINNIAMKHARSGELGKAMKLGFWLKKYMEDKVIDGKQKTAKYPTIVFNLSNWIGARKRFADALEVVNDGIDFCIKYGNLMVLPYLLYNKASCLAELERKEEARQFFSQSVVLFEIMKLEDRAKKATDGCKKNYGIEI